VLGLIFLDYSLAFFFAATFLAAVFLAGAVADLAVVAFFFATCGLLIPKEPLKRFPLAVRLSPLPIVIRLFFIVWQICPFVFE
jgi:hypothetical protein